MKIIFERPIQISSINRERSGISRPDDFVILGIISQMNIKTTQ